MMDERQQLRDGLAALGIALAAGGEDRLLAFRDLLLKWNRTYNLTAITDPQAAIAHHLLDSLAILPWVGEAPLLDVGSGGGLPGIPLAIARPALEVTMVDAVQKKVSFLQQAAIELHLPNARACHSRIEQLAGQYAQISSRAFAELADFIRLTRPMLAPGGRWLAMKGQYPEAELKALPADIRVDAVHSLVVPGLAAERHLIILKAGQ